MSSEGTVGLQRLSPFLPVRALRLHVIEGPDRGAELLAEGDSATVGTAEGNDLRLSDKTVSHHHLELARLDRGVRVVDLGSTNGTRLGAAQLERAIVPAGTELELGHTRLRIGEGDEALLELHTSDALGGLRGQTPAMRRLMARIERAAASDVSVLLVGESGTGKELVARALHELGGRAAKAFVAVDCGALTTNLVASELFGHERGAFTGADRRRLGAFERAQGGTVLLDEIGELPAELQTHLLGVLGRRRYRRVGGSEDLPLDVRIVSATSRDLRAEVNRASFRLDLYFRLAVVQLRLPPLRERREDIPLLVEHFLREAGYRGRVERAIGPEMMARLEQHSWPGNVRELRNFVQATLAMGEATLPDDALADPDATVPADQAIRPSPTQLLKIPELLDLPYRDARAAVLDAFELGYLERLMTRTEGNVSGAARAAGMDRSHLFVLLRRHKLR